MKNILIATDFSKYSIEAVNYVTYLVQRLQESCHILLLNTYLIPFDTSKEKLIEVKSRIDCVLKGKSITIETISQIGSLHNVILNIIDIKPINMVVMAACGGDYLSKIAKVLKEKQRLTLLVTY